MTLSSRISGLDWRRIAELGVQAVLVLVVIPFVLVAVPQLVGASNSYIVLSNSMADEPAPVLVAGDVIFVYDTDPGSIEAGDVITFHSGKDQVTTHRVKAVEESGTGIGFVTKGDANEEADPRVVPADNVVGTVGFYLPLLGRVIAFIGTSNGLLALVIVPSVLLILSELVNIGSMVRNKRRETHLVDGWQEDPDPEENQE